MRERSVVTESRTRGNELRLFFRNFIKHPRMLGSVVPSSRFLIDGLLQDIDWQRARVIVEYGPGIGSFTAEILRRMRGDAQLVAIETNPDFVEFLRGAYPDPRLRVMHDSAASTQQILRRLGHARADYIISGLPFSTMPAAVREAILRTTHTVLEPEGAFLLFQYSTRLLPDLQRIFRHVRRSFEPLNILPAQIFHCQSRAI
jgi:phospholipid N-methyltransferase